MKPIPSVRVLHVTAGLARQQGGPALNAVGIARCIRRAGGWNEIFSTDNREPASSRIHTRITRHDLPREAANLDVCLFRTQRPYRVMYSPDLGAALKLRASEFDVLHIHSLFLYPQFAAFRAARRHRLPYVVTIHGCLDPALRHRSRTAKGVTEALWQRRMLDQASFIHYTTEEERSLAADMSFAAPTIVIPNGIDLREFWPAALADATLEPRRPRTVLYVGRISHKKGLDILIEAFAKLQRSRGDVRLVVAGPDDEGLTQSLREKGAALGMADHVEFPGLLDATERLAALKSAAVWVLPSKTENFGTGVIEAMAMGVPVVISSAVNLAPEIAAAGAGLVVPRDPNAIADAVAGVLSDDEEHARLGAAGRAFASAYDWDLIAPRLLAMYQAAAWRRELAA